MPSQHGLKWRVSVRIDGKVKSVSFSTEEDARTFEQYAGIRHRSAVRKIPSIRVLAERAVRDQLLVDSRHVQRVRDGLGALWFKPGAEVTYESIMAVHDSWCARPYAYATRHLYMKVLKRVLRVIGQYEPHFERVRQLLPRLHEPVPNSRIVPDPVFKILHDNAPEGYRLLFLLMRDTGIRFTESMSIRPRMINFETGICTFIQKGNRERIEPLTERTLALARKCAESDPRCVDQLMGRFVSPSAVRTWFKRALAKYDLPHFSFHDLRRSFGTSVQEETHDVFAVKELLGHKSIVSTITYLRPFGPQKMKGIIERCKPNLEQEKTA